MLGATRRPGATLVGPRPPSHGSTAERAPTRPVGTHATAMDAAAALPALPRGHTPNTRWLAPTWDELRASGTIDGLPPRPPGWLPAGPTEYGLVRQDDAALTRAIHGGVLTGGRLNAVLGFAEGPLARRLKVPGSTGGAPGAARIAALLHIAQPLWAPADGLPGPRHTPSSFGRGGERKGGRRRGVGVSGGPRGPANATPSAVAAAGPNAVALAWGSRHEPAALDALAAALAPAGSRLQEVGLLWVRADQLATLGLPADLPLPPLGASPDALVHHTAPAPTVDAALRKEREEGGGDSDGGQAGSDGPAARAPPPTTQTSSPSTWTEVVEIKSVCPFKEAPVRGRGRRVYEVRDPGPHTALPARAVAQLQLEMLAAGAGSGLMVSSSATRGARVWRLARDDEFLRRALADVVSPAYVAHVLYAMPVIPGAHAGGWDAVAGLAEAALGLARGAEEVGLVPPRGEPDAGRAFLD